MIIIVVMMAKGKREIWAMEEKAMEVRAEDEAAKEGLEEEL